ncbi:MAG: capsular biosynthesis protein [Pseudomonadales bacterium]|jgi:protein-tyrosine phosphatase|nr:capsular biosynthesis protein [Pseudomonadales bacterium]MEC8812937.1 CpsB/CapC family capsule biosynthesis tyrosine phosphatase [Pseudomonadota bacterium]TNC85885.1 MAG: capsular biosynthesis protein [Alcanivorax sp.]HAU13263.1 capsular biosynthesis protein [Gammaproteobacteria bacterium]MBI25388.1 capsular biosynthesis protein [Pseudomonadales bacterium]|tara:strand:+ start:1002 stop:1739 length:738 start_codon:yes stop_codon:yes gene_type:complete
MYDLHCHLLPGIDDGPETVAESVALVRAAMADGITHAIVTPHIHNGRWDNDIASIGKAGRALGQALREQNIPLRLKAAAEVRLDAELPAMVKANRLLFLGYWEQHQILLLEMPHGRVLPGTDKMIAWLRKNHIIPMIAHPERNREIMKNPAKLKPLLKEGCLLQVTAGSLVGQFGEGAQRIAKALLDEDLITILASDAHNIKNRPPNLAAGYEEVARVVGDERADRLLHHNSRMIFESSISPYIH